jgi:hypothetical protein
MKMRIIPTLALLFAAASNVVGLHFYLDSNEERCFIEELPAATIVEGMSWQYSSTLKQLNASLGHYKALEWDPQTRNYVKNEEVGMNIEILVRCRGCSPPSAGMPLGSHIMLIQIHSPYRK